MSQNLAVVVIGATGQQGGAVVKSLLERGHEVRAVTRSTESAKARELANAGVTLVRASLEDTAALTKALEGSDLPLRDEDAIRRRHASRDATRYLRRGRGQGRRRTPRRRWSPRHLIAIGEPGEPVAPAIGTGVKTYMKR